MLVEEQGLLKFQVRWGPPCPRSIILTVSLLEQTRIFFTASFCIRPTRKQTESQCSSRSLLRSHHCEETDSRDYEDVSRPVPVCGLACAQMGAGRTLTFPRNGLFQAWRTHGA